MASQLWGAGWQAHIPKASSPGQKNSFSPACLRGGKSLQRSAHGPTCTMLAFLAGTLQVIVLFKVFEWRRKKVVFFFSFHVLGH